ncbi:putative channel exgression is glucose repressed by Mig1 and Mig2 protein [Rutstroemia sp. NJR-2017a BBW]|nr:putative channel exgression is glucose repressed by Mig1 and Mig2 protein [Rutstroemia sp. NJR-2017a BBW]
MSRNDPRLRTGELEIGYTEAVQRHANRYVVAPKPVSQRKLNFEHARPRWIRELAAEAMGVFFFVYQRYPGISSTASFFLNNNDPAFGSIFQIGWAFAIGIAFAIMIADESQNMWKYFWRTFQPSSNSVLCIVARRDLMKTVIDDQSQFPWKKVPQYILAQVFGSFMAGLLLVGQYHPQLTALAAEFRAKGLSPNSLGGPGSILCSVPSATETSYGYLFFIEFFADVFVGIVIWACLDPLNPFVSPAAVPWVIGLGYATMIWGFADVTIELNSARDLGTRLVAAIFYGGDIFGAYSPIPIFTSIPAMIFGTALYEMIQRDSFGMIAKGHISHENGEEGVMQHISKTGTFDAGLPSSMAGSTDSDVSWGNMRKNDAPV